MFSATHHNDRVSISLHRATDRFVTVAPGRTTAHSFSFGEHYDPSNVSHGGLVCHNDDVVAPGGGYPDHPHRDTEIVTWVLTGALDHRDDTGAAGVVTPELAQVMSAGSGVVHAETVAPDGGPCRFVQTWVRPDEPGGDPSYLALDLVSALAPGELVPVVSGSDASALGRIGTRGATMYAARVIEPGTTLLLPEAAFGHLFLASGTARLEGLDAALEEGDAVRLTGDTARRLVLPGPSELLFWTFS